MYTLQAAKYDRLKERLKSTIKLYCLTAYINYNKKVENNLQMGCCWVYISVLDYLGLRTRLNIDYCFFPLVNRSLKNNTSEFYSQV